jgi:hypothetical protein
MIPKQNERLNLTKTRSVLATLSEFPKKKLNQEFKLGGG